MLSFSAVFILLPLRSLEDTKMYGILLIIIIVLVIIVIAACVAGSRADDQFEEMMRRRKREEVRYTAKQLEIEQLEA